MSGYYDAGDEGDGLSAADRGTLNFYDAARQASQQAQQAVEQAQPPEQDTNDYSPYGTAYQDYGDQYSPGLGGSAQQGWEQAAPDYSSGVNDQAAGYAYPTPMPSFSAGVSNEFGGNDPGQQAPPFSAGITDEWGGNDPGQAPALTSAQRRGSVETGYTEFAGQSPINYYNPSTRPYELDPDGVYRQHNPEDYRRQTVYTYGVDDPTVEDAAGNRIAQNTAATKLGVAYWDPAARGAYTPEEADPGGGDQAMVGWYRGVRQDKWRSEYDTAVAAYKINPTPTGYALIQRLEAEANAWNDWLKQYNDGGQERLNRLYTQPDLAQRRYTAVGFTAQTQADEATNQQRRDNDQRQAQWGAYAEDRDAPGLWAQDRENYGTAVAREQTRFERLADEFTDRNRNGGLGTWVTQQGLTTRELDLVGLLATAKANGNDDQYNAALTQWLAMHDLDPRTMTGTLDREAPGFRAVAGAAYQGFGAGLGAGITGAGRVIDVGIEGALRAFSGSNPVLAAGIRQTGTAQRNALGVDGSEGNVGPVLLALQTKGPQTLSDAQLLAIADSAYGRAYGMTYAEGQDYGDNPLVAAERLRKEHPDWAFWSDQVAAFIVDIITGKFVHGIAHLPAPEQAAIVAAAREEALKQLPPPRSGAAIAHLPAPEQAAIVAAAREEALKQLPPPRSGAAIAPDEILPPGWSPTKEADNGVPGPSRNLPRNAGLPDGGAGLPAPVAAAEPGAAVGGHGDLLGGDPGAGVPEPVVAARPPSVIELPAPARTVEPPLESNAAAPAGRSAAEPLSSIPTTPDAPVPSQRVSAPVESAVNEVKRKIESGAMTTVPSASSKYWQRFGVEDGGEAIARLVDDGYVKPDQRGALTALPPERRAPAAPAARPTTGGEWADTLIASPDRTRALKAVNELVQANYPGGSAFPMEKTIGVRTLSTSLPGQQLRDYAEYLAARIRQPGQAQALEGLRTTNPNLYRALKELPPTSKQEVGALLRQVQSTHIPKPNAERPAWLVEGMKGMEGRTIPDVRPAPGTLSEPLIAEYDKASAAYRAAPATEKPALLGPLRDLADRLNAAREAEGYRRLFTPETVGEPINRIPPTPQGAAPKAPRTRAASAPVSIEQLQAARDSARDYIDTLLKGDRSRPSWQRDYNRAQKDLGALTDKIAKAEASQPAGSTVLYSLGPEFGKFAVNEAVGGGIGGAIGYALPAKDDDERWQHAAIGAKFGLGIAAIKYMSPTLSKEATKMLYPNSLGDRGIAETLWHGQATDLPGLGIARRKTPIFGILRNGQREIVGDRVGAALYHGLDAELADRGVVNLAASADKRIAAQVLKDLIDNPSAHNLTGVFEGTLGEQLKTFLKNHADELRDARTKILSDPVPGGGILTPAEVGRRYSDTVAELLADQKTKNGVIKGEIGNTKTDPLLRAQQSVVRELAQVWMTLNPRFHINNALSNLSAEIGDIFSDPTLVKDVGVLPGVRGRRAINQADIGTGNRYTRYVADDLTGNVPLNGKSSLINKVGNKVGEGLGAIAPGLETRARKLAGTPERLANAVEKSFKERRYDSNRVGYLSSRMRFEFGQQGLGIEGLGTLFSDHFNNLKPTLTGLPREVGEKLRGVVNANGATRILDDFATNNTITQVQRNQVLKTFRTALYDAERFADDKTAWAMRRYNIRSQGDWLLDHIVPLHFWTTHNILATARLAAKNPVLLAPLAAGLSYWADQNKDLPDNLKWTIELPYRAVLDFAVEHGIDPKIRQDVIDQVDSIYGENADIRLRPFNWLNPVVGGAVQQMSPKENAGQQAAMTMPQHLQQFMEAMGYNPSPVWDLVGGVLRRVPEAAGFKPIDVAGLNEKPYFGNSLLGTWGQWLRAGDEHMANWADANLGSDNVIRGAADLIREIPYKFNEVTYGARYTDYEHEAIARLIADRERQGQITHLQALTALRDGEKNPLFLSARQEFYDDGGKKGLVSWLGAPVSARNDYQRQRDELNDKYFAPGQTPEEKRAVIDGNQWIATDWAKDDSRLQLANSVATEEQKPVFAAYFAALDEKNYTLADKILADNPGVAAALRQSQGEKLDGPDKRLVIGAQPYLKAYNDLVAKYGKGSKEASAYVKANSVLQEYFARSDTPEEKAAQAQNDAFYKLVDGFFALPAPEKGKPREENDRRGAAQEAYLVANPGIRQYLQNSQGEKLDGQDKRDKALNDLLYDRSSQYFAAKEAGQTGVANRIISGSPEIVGKVWGKDPGTATDIWAKARFNTTEGDVNPSGRTPAEEAAYNAAMDKLGDFPANGTQKQKDDWTVAAKKLGWVSSNSNPSEGWAGQAAWGAAQAWGGKTPPGRTPEQEKRYTEGMAKLGDYPANGTSAQKAAWIQQATALGWKSTTSTTSTPTATGIGAAATSSLPKSGSAASSASVPRTPTTGASTTTARSSATSSAPRTTTASSTSARTTSSPARASTTAPRTSTAPASSKSSSGAPSKATYSSGLTQQTEAQKSAKPFLSGGAAKAQGLLDPKQFQAELTAYTKGDLGGYDRAVAMLDTLGKAGGNVTPYAQQILRTNMTTIATVIKAYKGTDRNQGQVQRAEWLRRMGAITPDLAGLKALRALWREVLPQQKAA